MTRRLLGLLVGAGLLSAVVLPANADAETDSGAAVPAGAVVAQPLDPAALEGQASSSLPQTGTGETSPSPSPLSLPSDLDGPRPQLVIGNDTRERVTPTRRYPASAVASIHINPVQVGLPSFICTGWFISKDALATAAHCVEYDNDGAFYTVIPGRNGGRQPFGTCNPLPTNGVFAPTSWIASGGNGPSEDDYAAFNLNCNAGNDAGWFGFRQVSNGKLDGLKQTISGYPSDKPVASPDGSQQWKSQGKVRRVNESNVFYKNDTVGGMSGGPVWRKFNNCGRCSVAIHTFGVGTVANPIENGGTRIRPEVGQFLNGVADLP